ncbi:unnamed protein product, partial [Didymodactylos carnosus]
KIIINGIEAVNKYHDITNGSIRPGACDQQQYFEKINENSQLSYLATTGNSDEGDIIMRILSVLINYQNNLLATIEDEYNENINNSTIIKNLVNYLNKNEIYIIQISLNHNSIISLSNNEYLWIEQISKASLLDENLNGNGELNFDFLYVQSYLVVRYLLSSRITYEHIHSKYQCYIKRQLNTNNILDDSYNIGGLFSQKLTDLQIETDWNHLNDMLLDKLYDSLNLLKCIVIILKDQLKNNDSNENLFSIMYLYNFLTKYSQESEMNLIQTCKIKDFQLCYIDFIRSLYEKHIIGFEHLFIGVPSALRTPIPFPIQEKLNDCFQVVNLNEDHHTIRSFIQEITNFLNELKTLEETFLLQSTESIIEICKIMAIEN